MANEKRSDGTPFIPAWLDGMDLTPVQFRVLCNLWRRAGKDRKCFPKAATIAKDCRIKRATVWGVIEALEERGLITRDRLRTSNLYRLRVTQEGAPSGPSQSSQKVPQTDHKKVPQADLSEGAPNGPQKVPPQKVRKKGTPKGGGDFFFDLIPYQLNCQAFHDKWSEWVIFRRNDRKNPITKTQAEKQLAMLNKFTAGEAITTLERSMTNGWSAIAEPRNEDGSRIERRPIYADEMPYIPRIGVRR